MESFHAVAPYLTNPIVLVGYVLFLLFGVHRLLLKSKVLSKISPESSHSLLRTVFRYGFILAILVILLGFAATFLKEYEHVPRDGQSTITKSPLASAPFRVQYFLLGGHMVDLFVQGKVDENWEKQLSGQPFIVRTPTVDKLNLLMSKFSEPFTMTYLMPPDYLKKLSSNIPISAQDDASAQQLAAKFREMPMFVGTDASLAAASAIRPGSSLDIDSLADPNYGWHIKASPFSDKPNGTDEFLFWRFGISSDLDALSHDRFAKPFVSWMQYATKDNFPHDFCIITMGSADCDPDHNQNVSLHTRAVYLRIATIENLTSQSIQVGPFSIRENLKEALRSREEDQSALNQSSLQVRKWFPPEMLGPHETIAIPLEIVLRYDKGKNWDLYRMENDSQPERLSSLRNELQQQSVVRLRSYTDGSEHENQIASGALIHLINQPAPEFGLQKEYIYGPSIKLESVRVDDAEYPVRQFNPRFVVMRDGTETGSCPYVYTYSIPDEQWINQGHILYGARGRARESLDSVLLPDFEGQIAVSEQEHEKTFLKAVYLSIQEPSGRKRKYYPTNWDSLKRQNGYIELKSGESIHLKFSIASGSGATPRLVVRGYYIPD